MWRYQKKRIEHLEDRVLELKQEKAALKKRVADLEGDVQSYIFSSNAWEQIVAQMREGNKPQAH